MNTQLGHHYLSILTKLPGRVSSSVVSVIGLGLLELLKEDLILETYKYT